MSSLDFFINPQSGTLHRTGCHTAQHLVDGYEKEYSVVGETLNGKKVFGKLRQEPTAIPLGVGVGWSRACKTCLPHGYPEVEP